MIEKALLQLEMKTPDIWVLRRQPKLKSLKVNTRRVYQALATEIRIQGINNAPKENMKNDRPLRVAIQEAIDHFTDKFPDSRLLAVDSQEKNMARVLFTKDISNWLFI